MLDLAPYRFDIAGFARAILGVELHPGQVAFAREVARRHPKRLWRAAWLTLCLSAGNRAGKTMILAIVILHSVVYKLGQQAPDAGDEKSLLKWMRRKYLWFHFAIQQEVAELVFTEIVTLLSGTHVAQKDGSPIADMFEEAGAKPADWEKKYNGDYRWIVFHEMLGGGEIHFRTTAERALGSLGRDMHGISFDECGFETKLQYIVDNVLHLRRLGTGGQLILVSTPEEGLTQFSDLWYLGDPDQPDRRPTRYSMRMSTRDNVGYGLDQDVFDALTVDMDEDHIKQNIDGHFIQGKKAYFNHKSVDAAFVDGMVEMEAARHGHTYVQGVDPALTQDSMWSLVFDVTDGTARGVMATEMRGKKTTDGIVELAQGTHYAYDVQRKGLESHCSTVIDATGFGGKMFVEQVQAGIPGRVRNVEFGGVTQKKRKLLGDLRTMLDQGRLKMPRSGKWLLVRHQLLGYKLEDRGIEQDAVMTLACVVSEARRQPAGGKDAVPFDAYATSAVEAQPTPWYMRRARETA